MADGSAFDFHLSRPPLFSNSTQQYSHINSIWYSDCCIIDCLSSNRRHSTTWHLETGLLDGNDDDDWRSLSSVCVCVCWIFIISLANKRTTRNTEKRGKPRLIVSWCHFDFPSSLSARALSFLIISQCMSKLLLWRDYYHFYRHRHRRLVFSFLFLWSSCRFWATFSRSIAALDWVIAKPMQRITNPPIRVSIPSIA
jgi:hypothetical protein